MSIHVLFLPSWYPIRERPARGIYFFEQAQVLKQHGLNVGVVFPEQRSLRHLSLQTIQANWFQVRSYNEAGLPTVRRHSWNIFWKLPLGIRLRICDARQLVQRYIDRFGRPDLIHAHSGFWAGAAAAHISRSHDLPFVLTEHYSGLESLSSWRTQLMCTSFQQATKLSAVSRSLRTKMAICEPLPDRIRILYNMVDAGFFTASPKREPSSPFRFFTLSNFHPWKGIDLLLKAFATSFRSTSNVKLMIGGDGPNRHSIEQLARTLQIDQKLNFMGTMSRTEVRDALWQSDAFVLPSRRETFGVPLIEAMATGLPIVATASGGPEDIVNPTVGRLTPPENVTALAQALQEMYHTVDQYDPTAIREQAVRRFGTDIFVRRTISLYEDALSAYHSS